MLDLLHLPTGYGAADVQIFNLPSTVTNTQWHTWLKPRGKTMMFALVIGGGAGGGGGFTAAASNARGGGGGGGSSAMTRIIVPLIFVPDRLYVQVGAGGIGVGSGGGTAGSAVLSYISVYTHATTASNILAVSGNAAAVGGGTGTGAAVGAAGTAGSIATIALMPLAGMGTFEFIAGQSGRRRRRSRGRGRTRYHTLPTTGVLTQGGSGGAGTTSADFAGGGVTQILNTLLNECKPTVAPAGSNNGSGGLTHWKPFFSFAGMGGASSNAGVGGLGGNGGYGSGGGGGGGGTTGGKGGDGGGGLVVIVCW